MYSKPKQRKQRYKADYNIDSLVDLKKLYHPTPQLELKRPHDMLKCRKIDYVDDPIDEKALISKTLSYDEIIGDVK